MTHWKPYRVLFRQGYHYFETLKNARDFIHEFERNKVEKPFFIEKLNKEKYKNPKYTYAEIYDNYEVWGWTRGKLRMVKVPT